MFPSLLEYVFHDPLMEDFNELFFQIIQTEAVEIFFDGGISLPYYNKIIILINSKF